jgi:hypothetical protein
LHLVLLWRMHLVRLWRMHLVLLWWMHLVLLWRMHLVLQLVFCKPELRLQSKKERYIVVARFSGSWVKDVYFDG